MENNTNNSFEEQWQRAFDDASLSPSEEVWERIDSELQNNIPPKPNNNFNYYLVAILGIILGVGLWSFMNKEKVIKPAQIVENKAIISAIKMEKVLPKEEKILIIKPKEKTPIRKISTPIKEEMIKPLSEPKIVTQIFENQQRIITDPIDFMSPIMATKKVNSELVNPSINIPFEQTPYNEILKPKPKKKSIWEKVRISGGVGVYQ